MTRKILLSCTGGSPQVVTETIYALAVQGVRQANGDIIKWVPDEVHLITTSTGAATARLALLHAQNGQQGWFTRLLSDYNLPPIHFPIGNIHILTDANGVDLDDVRTDEHNILAADQITELVRELTSKEDTELHVSIAGGRKTMGFFIGYALSLLGRKQDKLSHVLVSAPFETNPDFFYPTNYTYRVATNKEGTTFADAQGAKVDLSEIPFVRLRDGLPSSVIENRSSFSKVVEIANREHDLSLKLDPNTLTAIIHGEEFKFAKADFIVLLWFADQKKRPEEQKVDWSDPAEVADDFFMYFPKQVHNDYPELIDKVEVEKYWGMLTEKAKDNEKTGENLKKYLAPPKTHIIKAVKARLRDKLVKDYFPPRDPEFIGLDGVKITIEPSLPKRKPPLP
ncbi:hypothetical protein AGMMS50256_17390 [Betaproteobacteria bacterium]|nr:hypothetical protein AGMMS50256_17390 [Betaproteobacteria bacterium]